MDRRERRKQQKYERKQHKIGYSKIDMAADTPRK